MIQKVNTPGISSPVFPCFSPEIWSMFIQFWRPPRPPWPPWLRKSLRRGTTETARAARAGRSRSGATGRCCWEFWEVFWYFFGGKSWPKFGNEGGQSNCYNQMVNFWKHVDIMWRWDTEKTIYAHVVILFLLLARFSTGIWMVGEIYADPGWGYHAYASVLPSVSYPHLQIFRCSSYIRNISSWFSFSHI